MRTSTTQTHTDASNPFLAAALRYFRMGWTPIPLTPGQKKPPLVKWRRYQTQAPTEEQLRAWWKKWPNANVGILTGPDSNLLVIDTDSEEAEEALRELVVRFPETPTSRTAKGRHRLFVQPHPPIANSVRVLPAVDVRGEGGYIVAPPSIHPSGCRYAWEHGLSPDDVVVAELPQAILELLIERNGQRDDETSKKGPDDRGLDSISTKRVHKGERNTTLARLAGKYFGRGLAEGDVLERCMAANREFVPPLDADEVIQTVESIAARHARRQRGSELAKPGIESVSLADVRPEPVRWLWHPYLPYGKLVLIDGDPDVGKSSITLDLAARISSGKVLQDGKAHPPATVILIGEEDGLADTVVPRLTAMGADLARVRAISGLMKDGALTPLRFPEDLTALEEIVRSYSARLVVIDPITSFVSGNQWADHIVRPIMTALAKVAERTGAVIVMIRHLNKKEGLDAKYRGGGSVAFSAVSRVHFLVGIDPTDASQRVLAKIKNNLARHVPSLAFSLVDCTSGGYRVEWRGVVDQTPNDLLVQRSDQKPTKHEQAKTFVIEQLANGEI